MIDVVGHFGSRLSYATIADQLTAELASRGELGVVTNLDDQWLSGEHSSRPLMDRSRKVILLSDPQEHLVSGLSSVYGNSNVAIFVCPNTDSLSPEREEACRNVGRIYTPSRWCLETLTRAARLSQDLRPFAPMYVYPLGVDEPFTAPWPNRTHDETTSVSMLHVTTDTFWPGRKGTEELLRAWKLASLALDGVAHLTIHCLPQLLPAIHQELGDLDLVDKVSLVASERRGISPSELASLFSKHDILVAPSRSEGFGVMPLSALLLGMPVLTTADTGQGEYLGARTYLGNGESGEHQLSGWLQIPTTGASELYGEDGQAPDVREDQLAMSLLSGTRLCALLKALAQSGGNEAAQVEWSWATRRAAWVDSLLDWENRT